MVNADVWIFRAQELGHLRRGLDQFGGVLGVQGIQSAVPMHDHRVPWPLSQDRLFVVQMPVKANSAVCFQEDFVGESRLLREGLEERRQSSISLQVQVCHRLRPVVLSAGVSAVGEAVANEENALSGQGAKGKR